MRLIKPGLDLNKFLFKLKPEQFARQLVLSEFEVFQKLQKTEFLNQSWLNPKLKHRSPNILRILERFFFVVALSLSLSFVFSSFLPPFFVLSLSSMKFLFSPTL